MEKQRLRLKDVIKHIECTGEITIMLNAKPIHKDTAFNFLSMKKYLSILEYNVGCIMAVNKQKYEIHVNKESSRLNEIWEKTFG